jgi:hypothetical protein
VTELDRGFAFATLGLSLLVAPAELVAAERVELVERSADCELNRELATQLRAELEAAGFDVVEPPLAESTPPVPARFAVVSCEGAGESSIAVSLLQTGRDPDRRIFSGNTDESTHSLVLRVTEFLRARVVEVSSPPTPETSVAVPPPSQPEAENLAYTAELGAAALLHPGGLAFSIAPAIALGVELTRPLRIELRASGPFLGTENGGAGSANVDQELALLGVRFVVLDGVPDVFVSAAAGAFRLGARGEARPPFQSLTNSALSAVLAAGAGSDVRVATAGNLTLTLGARADAALLMPQPALRLAETAVARAGQPAYALTATIGARF